MHSKHPNWCRKHIGRIGKQNQQGCLVRRPIRWNNRQFQTAPLISWYPAQPHTKTLLCFLLYLTEVAHQPAEVLKSVGRTLFTAFLLISQGSGVHSPAFTSFIFFSFLFSIFFLLKNVYHKYFSSQWANGICCLCSFVQTLVICNTPEILTAIILVERAYHTKEKNLSVCVSGGRLVLLDARWPRGEHLSFSWGFAARLCCMNEAGSREQNSRTAKRSFKWLHVIWQTRVPCCPLPKKPSSQQISRWADAQCWKMRRPKLGDLQEKRMLRDLERTFGFPPGGPVEPVVALADEREENHERSLGILS